tara:strand:- start:8138 stop:9238 length:1101 start_codon:yes stop_codon:yes gene_type:complete
MFVADVLVVGGGVIGMLSALELQARGAMVVVYDAAPRRPPASWAGGGILSPLFPWRYSAGANALCVDVNENYQCWAQRIIEAGGVDPEITVSGLFAVCADKERQVAEWAKKFGYEYATKESSQGAGYWLPDIGSIRNGRLMKGLATLMAARGIPLLHAEVDQFYAGNDGVTVHIGSDRVTCDQLLVAAGWWSSSLLSRSLAADVCLKHVMQDVFPAKGEMLLYRAPQGLLKHIILTDEGYLIPRRDGHILVGSTHQEGISDMRPSVLAADTLVALGQRLLPALKEYLPVAQWTGVRPGHRRDVPLIDYFSGSERVWLSSGHYRNGLVAAPGSARLVAQRISGEATDLDPSFYSFSSPGSSDSFCKR